MGIGMLVSGDWGIGDWLLVTGLLVIGKLE
jgi:hypothetical protein